MLSLPFAVKFGFILFRFRLKFLSVKAGVECIEILTVKSVGSKSEAFTSNGFPKKRHIKPNLEKFKQKDDK